MGVGITGSGLGSINISYNISHGDVKYSIGNRVDNTIITMYGDRWLLDCCSHHLVRYINIEFLCYIPETNIMLYVNCI